MKGHTNHAEPMVLAALKRFTADDRPEPSGINRRGLVLDVVSFVVTVAVAVALKWQTRDLVWALWAASLCVGYASIVTSIVSGVLGEKGKDRLAAAAFGLFLLGFFTIHFGMFHFVHGVFLNTFFPLVGERESFPNIGAMLGSALRSYWPFVLTSFLSRLGDFRPKRGSSLAGNAFGKPYANVIRMHFLIFVFAGLHAAGLSGYAIYPVLVFYFFPWGEVMGRIKRKKRGR
jgi:hypothetical protein